MKRTMMKLSAIATCLVVGTMFTFLGTASAADDYPSKDVKLIINSSPGGGTDTIHRKLASLIEKEVDATFFVVNKPGSGAALGPYEVMRARPDGYTIGNLVQDSVVSAVYTKLIPNYDLNKLNIFAIVSSEPEALMVKGDSPYKTFEDFIAAAKAKPGEVRLGITSIGGRPSILALQMQDLYGVKFNTVQYVEGAPAQREALLSGEADAVLTSLGDFNAVLQNKQVRGLVEFSLEQNETYPDVPTIASKGHPELEIGSFAAMAAPADTPQPIIDKLEKLYYNAQHSKDFRDWCVSVGVSPTWYGQKDAAKFIKDTQAKAFKVLDRMKAEGILK